VYDTPATRRLIRDAANSAEARTNGIKSANGTLKPPNVTVMLFTSQGVVRYDG
jgi:hypothetical protein